MLEKVNLLQAANSTGLFDYLNVGNLNGHSLSVLQAENRTLDFHVHEHSDELFYVIEGQFEVEMEDGLVPLAQGDLLIIPKGTRHRPVVTSRVKCLLMELEGTLDAGNTGGAVQVDDAEEPSTFFSDIAAIAGQLHAHIEQAVVPLRAEVNAVIRQRSTDSVQIERLFESLLDYAAHNNEALALFKRLGRYYYPIDPETTESYVMAYKELYESDDDSEEEEPAP